MKVLRKSSPILIPISRFSDFSNYLGSLSKGSQQDFVNNALKLNKDLSYGLVNFSHSECRKFMDLWSECNGWGWGDWYRPEELQDLHNRGILKCFKSGGGYAYHFVLKWGRYVYCNAPLYDTRLHKDREISKWMWLKLVEYSISNDWVDFLDMMGPEELSTYGEVIKNRAHTDQAGDFGYKWKFVPKDIKDGEDKSLDHLEIISEKKFIWKGIELPPEPTKLLIVSHPDDEAIFFGDWLMENGPRTKVVCLTSSMNFDWWQRDRSTTRFNELQSSLRAAGVNYFECLEQDATLDPLLNKDYIKTFLNKVKQEADWEVVLTHNQYGEYGHLQHIETYEMVREVFPHDRIFIYKNSSQRLPTNRKQILLDKHESQQEYCIREIKHSEWTGSDWYKHTEGKNMIDYESIIKLNDTKTSYQIALYWGEETKDHHTFDFISKFSEKLGERGHKAVVSRVFDSWPWDPDMLLTFRVVDAIECIEKNRDFYFFVNEEALINEQNFEEYREIVDKSVRSFTRTWKIRNEIGDRKNLVWLPRERDWDILIRKAEAHLLMGMVGKGRL